MVTRIDLIRWAHLQLTGGKGGREIPISEFFRIIDAKKARNLACRGQQALPIFGLLISLNGKLSASPRLTRYVRLGSDGALVEAERTLTNHVIVCGHGRAGSNLASTLGRYEIPYVVVELNPRIVSELRASGIPCVYGDAGNTHILEAANVGQARVLALTCPDPLAEVTATAYAKSVNPGIDVIARLPDEAVDGRLRAAGASEVVEPAFEASLEFVRHILRYYGVSGPEVENLVCPFLREHRSEEAEPLPKS